MSSTDRRSNLCRPSLTCSPSGASVASASITHVEVAGHYYSVPYRFARADVDVRLTARGSRFSSRANGSPRICAQRQSQHTTLPEHMPSSHRRYAGWTIERIRARRRAIGPATAALCELILEAAPSRAGLSRLPGIVRLVGPSAPIASKPPPTAPSTSAPGPTAR